MFLLFMQMQTYYNQSSIHLNCTQLNQPNAKVLKRDEVVVNFSLCPTRATIQHCEWEMQRHPIVPLADNKFPPNMSLQVGKWR